VGTKLKLQLQRLVDKMHAASGPSEAVALLRESGEVLDMRLPCALNDVSGNHPVCDAEGRRIADLLGWPTWITDNWYDHAYVRQHPIYLRCRFESRPFGTVYAQLWQSLETLTPAQQQLKKDTERLGIVAQITAPIHLPLGRIACVLWSTRETVDIDKILKDCGHFLTLFGELFIAIMQPPVQVTLGPKELAHLTDRQIDCLHWLASGKTIHETAIILNISTHTVREHLRIITERLHAVNTPNAIALATQYGIIGRTR
jgi:DNA-binding CsgD family transcriptional regulator